MKQPQLSRKISVFGLAILAAFTGLTVASSFADEYPHERRENHRHEGDSFAFGVCVGQTLATQGVTLPTPTPGSPYLSSSDQQSVESAAQTCREEFRGTEPSPEPSTEPSATPSDGTNAS
jgi:hypothetical protein